MDLRAAKGYTEPARCGFAMLEIKGFSAGYESGFVVRDVSLKVRPGEFVAVLGRNGSGKSTLIRAVQGLLGNVRGEARVDGRDIASLGRREIARKIAYVPQLSEPIFDFTAEEIVLMGRYARQGRLGAVSTADAAAVDQAMAATRIRDFKERKLSRLSGGERQRVFIARALAQDAPLLLLDEPSLHLDISYQVEIYGLLKGLQREKGKTIVAAEHNVNLAAAHADRLLFLKDGAVAAEGGPRETVTAANIHGIFGADVDIRANARTGLPEISLAAGGKSE